MLERLGAYYAQSEAVQTPAAGWTANIDLASPSFVFLGASTPMAICAKYWPAMTLKCAGLKNVGNAYNLCVTIEVYE